MAHLMLLVAYASISLVVSMFDMLLSYRIIKEEKDSFFFYIALVLDALVIIYLLVGLVFAVWAFWGMPAPDKEGFIGFFFIYTLVLAIMAGTVIFGVEDIIWRNPGEFIDLTWLFELVILGYHITKWVIVLSYTIALAEVGRAAPSAPAYPAMNQYAYQPVQQIPMQEMQPMYVLPKEQTVEQQKPNHVLPAGMAFQVLGYLPQ